MTREEAMTLITQRLGFIHTGSSGAGIELLIQIVQAGAAAEREACAKVCLNVEGMAGDYADKYAAAIRARRKE